MCVTLSPNQTPIPCQFGICLQYLCYSVSTAYLTDFGHHTPLTAAAARIGRLALLRSQCAGAMCAQGLRGLREGGGGGPGGGRRLQGLVIASAGPVGPAIPGINARRSRGKPRALPNLDALRDGAADGRAAFIADSSRQAAATMQSAPDFRSQIPDAAMLK